MQICFYQILSPIYPQPCTRIIPIVPNKLSPSNSFSLKSMLRFYIRPIEQMWISRQPGSTFTEVIYYNFIKFTK